MNFGKDCDIDLSMVQEKKYVFYAIFLIFFFLLGASLFINIHSIQGNFLFADEAIYYSLTQSLAHDGDLEYTKKDLIRYFQAFDSGPIGLFLKKGKDNKIFFAKSFAYPIFASPFVKIFGCNGFFIFHSILFLLLLLMGSMYFSLGNRPALSLLIILTFLFASVAIVYIIWISPDFFNLFLVFSVLFLWLYKHKNKEVNTNEEKKNKIQTFLLSDHSDYLACILVGIAVFSKPPNIVLMAPLVLHSLFKKKFKQSFLMVLVFILTSCIFWGSNQLVTGNWNYQGGERKIFHFKYPYEKEHLTFDSTGFEMTSEGYAEKHLLPPKVFIYNIFYYFWGRFTGISWYFFPAVLFIVLFFIRKKRPYQWFVFGAIAAEILIYITIMPDNYAGGGGALANRYFLNLYPLFLFLPDMKMKLNEIGISWIIASIFIAQILLSPFQHSHYPATHAKKFPFKMLPVELTLVNNFPTNTNPEAFRQPVGTKNSWLHFLDDNFIPRQKESKQEKSGFWTRGSHTSEMILKTWYPVKKILFHVLNNPRMRNEITVQVGSEKKKIILSKNQRGTLSFDNLKPFIIKATHLYKIKIKASKGSIPYLEEEKSAERRFLGTFFELEIIPENE